MTIPEFGQKVLDYFENTTHSGDTILFSLDSEIYEQEIFNGDVSSKNEFEYLIKKYVENNGLKLLCVNNPDLYSIALAAHQIVLSYQYRDDERKKKILPILNELHDWLVKIQPTVIPELKFGKAKNYALNSWEHILNYIECPEIYLDNSIAERSIKPFVLGRKNWLFAGSEDGARSSCLLFSLIECAKIHNINPEDYLRCIFEQAANTDSWSENDWKKLLPWNIKITSFIPQGIWISSKRVEN